MAAADTPLIPTVIVAALGPDASYADASLEAVIAFLAALTRLLAFDTACSELEVSPMLTP